jgi:PhoH-like ATPase
MGNAVIVDTNILIHDPDSIDTLRENGANTLFVPWMVWMELDKLKTKPDVGVDARECIRRIEKIRMANDPALVIWKTTSFKGIKFLNKDNPDHQIIAAAISVKKHFAKEKERKFDKFKFLSRDTFVRATAREIDNNGLLVETYNHDRVEVDNRKKLKHVCIADDDFYTDNVLIYRPEVFGDMDENEGVVCKYENGDSKIETFAAIRKDCYLQIIPENISAFGISPKLLENGETNWSQHVAFRQLLDPKIRLVFLEGGAGTGKTLLALACALEQRKYYTQIALTRPMVHLENDDKMGFLPGKISEKMDPWLRPLWMSLQFLGENQKSYEPKSKAKKDEPKKVRALKSEKRIARKTRKEEKVETEGFNGHDSKNKSVIEDMKEKGKIIIEPLDFIRGMSYPGRIYLILDEGQNTSPHVIKTIITRAGEGTKIIITGDLSQIDIKWLDKNSSGLANAMVGMRNNPLVGTTCFKDRDSVRSPLAKLALERLR